MSMSQVFARSATKVRKRRSAVGSHKALCDRRRTLLLEQLEPRRLLSGVQQVFQLHTGGSSLPADLTVFNDELYFRATTPDTGGELWKVDAGGTVTLAADVRPGSDGSLVTDLTVFDNELYFTAFQEEVWKIDAAGTDIASSLA